MQGSWCTWLTPLRKAPCQRSCLTSFWGCGRTQASRRALTEPPNTSSTTLPDSMASEVVWLCPYWAGRPAIKSEDHRYHRDAVLLQGPQLQVQLFGLQDVWCGRSALREEEVDPLLRRCDLYHLHRCSERIRHGAGGGWWSGRLSFVVHHWKFHMNCYYEAFK